MEPDYSSLDPQERTDKLLAFFSLGFGLISLCAGLIPIVGILISVIGFTAGLCGRRSERKVIANIGLALSAFGLLLALVYAAIQLMGV